MISKKYQRTCTVFQLALLVLAFSGVVGCSSPTEKANAYYQKGEVLLKKNELVKARIEFQNALQIDNKMLAAYKGLAEIAEREGDWKAQFGLLGKVLDLDPKNLNAQVKLGRMLLAAGKLDKALEASNEAYVLNKDDHSVLALRAAVKLRLDDPRGAVENANLVLDKDPGYADALAVLAVERFNAADYDKSVEYIDKALSKNDKNVALQLIKVQALTQQSKTAEAEAIFRKLIGYYPDSKDIRTMLAKFYVMHDRKDDAEKELRAIADARPDDLDAKTNLIRFLVATKGPQPARLAMEAYAAQQPKNYALQFSLIGLYQSQNDRKAAEIKLKQIMQAEGDSADGLTAKGMMAALILSGGDKQSAEKLVGEILNVDKRNEQALILKSTLLIEARKYDEAVADLRTILRDAPNSSRALFLLAKAHEGAGATELADENYQRAFQAGKMAAIYGLPYAESLLKRNQPEHAEKILEQVLLGAPGNMGAIKMLAQSRIARGDWAGAQEIAERVRKMDEKGNLADQIHGAILAGQKNYTGGIAAFKRAYEAAPAEVQPLVALVRTYLMAGKTKEAAAFLTSVLENNPDNFSALEMQGQLYMMSGDRQKAIDAFNKLISLQPKQPRGYQALSTVYTRDRKFAEAEQVIHNGLAAVPGDLGLRMGKAALFEQSGRHEEAIKVYEEMIKLRPDSDVVANNLASLLSDSRSDKSSLQRAYDLSQRFRKSEVPYFKDTYGWASYRIGRYDEAQDALKTVVEKLPAYAVFHYHLGMTYIAKFDKANGRKELEKALELSEKQPLSQAEEIRSTLKGL